MLFFLFLPPGSGFSYDVGLSLPEHNLGLRQKENGSESAFRFVKQFENVTVHRSGLEITSRLRLIILVGLRCTKKIFARFSCSLSERNQTTLVSWSRFRCLLSLVESTDACVASLSSGKLSVMPKGAATNLYLDPVTLDARATRLQGC